MSKFPSGWNCKDVTWNGTRKHKTEISHPLVSYFSPFQKKKGVCFCFFRISMVWLVNVFNWLLVTLKGLKYINRKPCRFEELFKWSDMAPVTREVWCLKYIPRRISGVNSKRLPKQRMRLYRFIPIQLNLDMTNWTDEIAAISLPSVGTTTDTQPAGDHMYNLLFAVQMARRGCLGSHWNAKGKKIRLIWLEKTTAPQYAYLNTFWMWTI